MKIEYSNFEKIGLNSYEAKVYKSLLRLGSSTASEISGNSNVPYGRIYDVLQSLENKGLVKTIPEKTKRFSATSPRNLQERINEHKQILEKLEEEVKNYKNIYERGEKEPVLMVKGRRNFYKLAKEFPKTEEFVYDVKYSSEFKPDWVKEYKEHKRKGIEHLMLSRVSEETEENLKQWLKIDKDIKSFENEGVAISINEKAILIALIRSNVTLLIRNKAFINLMRRMFLTTYEKSEYVEL